MTNITLTVGLPGSGKSTWTKEQIQKSKRKIVNINRDDVRQTMVGGNINDYKFSKANENYIQTNQIDAAVAAVSKGWDIIVSDTNMNSKTVTLWKDFAKEHKCTFKMVNFFDLFKAESSFEAPHDFFMYNKYVEQCKTRDLLRLNSVGSDVIDAMAEKSYYSHIVYPPAIPDLEDAIIVDIDGTIAHMNGRSPYDESRVGEDAPDMEVILSILAEAEFLGRKVIIMSGRHDTCKELTIEWLEKYYVPYDHLFMRAADDNRPDDIVKYELYMNNVYGKYNVCKVYDDRDKVVFMWRKLLGLKVMQVNYGNF